MAQHICVCVVGWVWLWEHFACLAPSLSRNGEVCAVIFSIYLLSVSINICKMMFVQIKSE